MSVDNNDTTTKAGERLEDIIDQLSAAGVNDALIAKTYTFIETECTNATAKAARLFYRPLNGRETLTPLDFGMHLSRTKRRAWALSNALADILNDEDDAGSAGTKQLVEDVVMGIERLSEAFDAEKWLTRKQEAG